MKLREWLDKGEGGEWFESYITNRDIIIMFIIFLFIISFIFGISYLMDNWSGGGIG